MVNVFSKSGVYYWLLNAVFDKSIQQLRYTPFLVFKPVYNFWLIIQIENSMIGF